MARECQPLALKIFGLPKMTTSVNDCQPMQYGLTCWNTIGAVLSTPTFAEHTLLHSGYRGSEK